MQIVLPPEVEIFVQRQLSTGKYQNVTEVLLAAVTLLQAQEDIYRGRLSELQTDALLGWEAAQRGEVIDGATALAQIRTNLRSRYSSSPELE
jgi:antitoxin ParD1/3/4